MRCPYCSEEIEEEAVICGHCGAAVMEPEGSGVAAAEQEQGPGVGASAPREMETLPPATNWRFWFDFVAASLLGGLTMGVLGGFVAGSLLVPFLAGALGGVIGGGVAAGIHQLGLRRYVSLGRSWVLVCCLVGAATWLAARSWAAVDLGSWDPVSFERDRLAVFVAVGAAAGSVAALCLGSCKLGCWGGRSQGLPIGGGC